MIIPRIAIGVSTVNRVELPAQPAYRARKYFPVTQTAFVCRIFIYVEPLESTRPLKTAVELCCVNKVRLETEFKCAINWEHFDTKIIVSGFAVNGKAQVSIQSQIIFHSNKSSLPSITNGR